MKLAIGRDELLQPLQRVIGAVERKQTNPILTNILFNLSNGVLTLTATDSEIEVQDSTVLPGDKQISTTMPARKLHDILKSLPSGAQLTIEISDEKTTVYASRSRFSLTTLAAEGFPKLNELSNPTVIKIPEKILKTLLEMTAFSMAQQDVRYYLNGLLLEITSEHLRSVTTDGHRLSTMTVNTTTQLEEDKQTIIPRKAVSELIRLLDSSSEEEITLNITSNHIQVCRSSMIFTSKVIDGKFPDYRRVIPSNANRQAIIPITDLSHALQRVSILSHEKYRGVELKFQENQLIITANNPEQEQAEDGINIDYSGEEVSIAFNINYLSDVLSSVKSDSIIFNFSDANNSALLTAEDNTDIQYVVMPIRL